MDQGISQQKNIVKWIWFEHLKGTVKYFIATVLFKFALFMDFIWQKFFLLIVTESFFADNSINSSLQQCKRKMNTVNKQQCKYDSCSITVMEMSTDCKVHLINQLIYLWFNICMKTR